MESYSIGQYALFEYIMKETTVKGKQKHGWKIVPICIKQGNTKMCFTRGEFCKGQRQIICHNRYFEQLFRNMTADDQDAVNALVCCFQCSRKTASTCHYIQSANQIHE